MCSISVCSFKLIPFMVWTLWPEQKFKVKSWLFQKSRADNFRMQTATKIIRPMCTTTHHRYSLWQVSKNSNGNCRRSCAHKKLLMDGQTDERLGYNIIQAFGCIKKVNTKNILMPSTFYSCFHTSTAYEINKT